MSEQFKDPTPEQYAELQVVINKLSGMLEDHLDLLVRFAIDEGAPECRGNSILYTRIFLAMIMPILVSMSTQFVKVDNPDGLESIKNAIQTSFDALWESVVKYRTNPTSMLH